MKLVLTLSILICNYCIAQNKDSLQTAIDSLPISTKLEKVPYDMDINPHKDNFMFADTVWVNKDTTYYIFRYFTLSSKNKK